MKNSSVFGFLSSPQRRFLLVGGVYIALWLATWGSASLLDRFGVVSLWYLPAGLRFAGLLVLGWRGLLLELIVQLIFAVTQVTSIAGAPIVDFWSGNTLWRLYNLFGSLVGNAAILLVTRRLMKTPLDFMRPRHSTLFLALAVVVSAWSAGAGTIGLLGLGVIQHADQQTVAMSWMIGDFIGIITLAPLLLVRVAPGLQRFLLTGRWSGPRKPAASSRLVDLRTVLAMIFALLLVFAFPWSQRLNEHFPLVVLLLLLPLAGVALNYSLRATVLAVVVLDGGLVILISAFSQQQTAMQYQIVMISIALVGLLLSGSVEARNRQMARYGDFASVSNDLLWEIDRDGVLVEASGKLAAFAELVPGKHWRSVLGRGDAEQQAALEDALAGQRAFHQLELPLPGPNGTPRIIQLNGLPVFDPSGELLGYRGTAIDVSVAREAETVLRDYNERLRQDVQERTCELAASNDELAAKERHLQVLLAAAPVGVLEFDEADRCRYVNANGSALIGRSVEDAKGLSLLDLVHPDDREYVRFIWQNIRQSEDVQLLEFRLNRTNLRCAAHLIRIAADEQPGDGTIMVLTNATARSQQDERLWSLAHQDSLTGLPNRNLFRDRLEQALRHARRHGNGAAVLWLDLDGFKAVNDRFGHAAGDLLLQQVAGRLKNRVRASDTVARMGGDEFAVVMPEIGEAGLAEQVAQQLVSALIDTFELPQGAVQVSGSIGVALYPQHAQTPAALTQCADMAMYAAKHAGKNQVHVWKGD